MLNGKYFEFNIQEKMPGYINPKVRTKWRNFYQTVSDRFELLQEALEISGLRGEDFSAAAQKLFDKKSTGNQAIDSFDPFSLAELCKGIACTMPPQPDRMVWPNADTVCDIAFLATPEWEFLRSVGIGGSEAAAILDCSPYTTARAVYNRKVHADENPYYKEKKDNTFLFAYGHYVEDLVIETFLRQQDATRIPETRMFRHKDYPWLIADMDGIVTLPDGKQYIFEAKTTNWRNAKEWEDGCIPPQYDPQCRHYMGVMNDPRISGCVIACIYGNSEQCFRYTTVERDIYMEADQNETVSRFWNENILADEAPPLTSDGNANFEDIRKYCKGDPELPQKTITDNRIADLCRLSCEIRAERLDLQHQVKALQEREDRYNSEAADLMGDYTKAVVMTEDKAESYAVTWSSKLTRSVPASGITRLKKHYPQAFSDCFIPYAGGREYVESTSSPTPGLLDLTSLKNLYPSVYDEIVKKKETRSFSVKQSQKE